MRHLGALVFLLLGACSSPSRPPIASSVTGEADAAADASTTQTHAAGSWCAGRAEAFCDDLDTPGFTSKWWSVEASNGAGGTGLPPGALDTRNYTSAPNGFTARTPAIPGPMAETQQIKTGGSGPDASHVDAELAFSVRAAALGDGARTEIARIEGVNPITFATYAVALLLSKSGASIDLVQGSQAKVTMPVAAPVRVGSWSRIAIRLGLERTVDGSPTSVVIQIDGAPPETFSMARGMGVRPFLRLGLAVTGPSAPCEVAYDDVTYQAR
ncbi:MAG: hypothetical protein HOO96_38705 [Polyangiaceae bacterium]|nr:hypothetical protein [Polyangiaceae bacterium]